MAPRRRLPPRWPILPISEHFLQYVIHELAVEQWNSRPGGPMPEWEIDKPHLLKSALLQPYQTVGGRFAYPAVLPKAACLFRGLVKNHGLVDGNKRMGVTATGIFLAVNGYNLRFTPDGLRDYALEVAGHDGNYPVKRIERWLRAHVVLKSPGQLATLRRQLLELYAVADPVEQMLRRR